MSYLSRYKCAVLRLNLDLILTKFRCSNKFFASLKIKYTIKLTKIYMNNRVKIALT